MTRFDFKDIVKITIKSSIKNYLDSKKKPDSEHVVLDRIFPTERYIRSIMGGLETSLGTTLWESIARQIALHNGFEARDPKTFLMPDAIPIEIHSIMNKWQHLREVAGANVSLNGYVDELRHAIPTIDTSKLRYARISKGKGVDLWLVKDGVEYAFDLKTVQINAGNGVAFNIKLIEWYAYRLLQDPSLQFQARMVFPYCPFVPPTIDSWWKQMGGRAYPLLRNEDAWVQDDFWDFLTGEPNTWSKIVDVIDEIAKEDFAATYKNRFYRS